MKSFTMTAGTYYITDCCSAHEGYYDDFLLQNEWHQWGVKLGSTFIRETGADGSGFVYDMENNIIGRWGSDAGNISVVPAKVCSDMDKIPHYGTMVTFEEDFIIKVYHDSIVVGDKYRARHWNALA